MVRNIIRRFLRAVCVCHSASEEEVLLPAARRLCAASDPAGAALKVCATTNLDCHLMTVTQGWHYLATFIENLIQMLSHFQHCCPVAGLVVPRQLDRTSTALWG